MGEEGGRGGELGIRYSRWFMLDLREYRIGEDIIWDGGLAI